MADAAGERLQKVLARVGIGSRRACEELIAAGRVTVNGEVAVLGRRVDPAVDRVEVDGVPAAGGPGARPLPAQQAGRAWSRRPRTPTAAARCATSCRPSPGSTRSGGLDRDSEGLLLLTNDGDLTFRLTHPSFGVAKEYLVSVEGDPAPAPLRRLREGVDLDDGRTAPARVAAVAPGVLRIVIHEGRNRQVRRMCEAIGHPVTRLVRTRIGPLVDPTLAPGSFRSLTTDEVRALAAAAVPAGRRSGGPVRGP